jgi:lipopolysaccharide transport system ATP-binding protein
MESVRGTAPQVTSNEDFAVRVENVSKVYGLWSSPGARLGHPLLRIAQHVAPDWLGMHSSISAKRQAMRRDFQALHDVSLEIAKGESWGIIGVNGSGKSTLLKIISGNLAPSGGRVTVDGKVAILEYSAGLHGAFTGRENIYMKGGLLGLTRNEIDDRLPAIVNFADIGEFIDQPVKTYSSGMSARLGFSIIAHVEADIIIADEALAVGDAFFVQKSMNFLRSFIKRGTFIFVSHSTGDVISLCEKAVWLDRGEVRKIGPAKEVGEAYLAQNVVRMSEEHLRRQAATSVGEQGSGGRKTGPEAKARIEQPEISNVRNARPGKPIRDRRLELLNQTQWRNDIHIPDMNGIGAGYGVGGAQIEEVVLEDDEGARFSSIVGGECVNVRITARAERDMTSPIVGFQVQDRLGQTLFADNTYFATLSNPVSVRRGDRFSARFGFQMPLLPIGEYAIRAAVAVGKDTDAAMLHVIDTALIFRSTASGARYGLIGIPMQYIELEKAWKKQLYCASPRLGELRYLICCTAHLVPPRVYARSSISRWM